MICGEQLIFPGDKVRIVNDVMIRREVETMPDPNGQVMRFIGFVLILIAICVFSIMMLL